GIPPTFSFLRDCLLHLAKVASLTDSIHLVCHSHAFLDSTSLIASLGKTLLFDISNTFERHQVILPFFIINWISILKYVPPLAKGAPIPTQ
ncbi:hypothetical protein CEXT_440231, partial [Caerostris extrusa]